VADIGANDGTLLSAYPPFVRKIAFEPSDVVPQGASIHVPEFFSAARYQAVSRPPARLITSIAMLYDLDDPVQFAHDIAACLEDNGLWVAEQHWLPHMLAANDYSVICHEHLTYLTVAALEAIIAPAGLVIEDVSLHPVNGGSFRAFIRPAAHARPTERVAELKAREAGLEAALEAFAERVKVNRYQTLELLYGLKAQGKRLAGLGASTKFNTVVGYCGLTTDALDYIVDRNPAKVGLTLAGARIPIISEAEGRRHPPDVYVLGPYHFLESLARRERDFLAGGGQFLTLFPEPRLVTL
jgi:hypothetical protein